jgi:hypothetical protein
MSNKKYVAHHNLYIQGMQQRTLRFETLDRLRDCLNDLRNEFTVSTLTPDDEPDVLVMWIIGYEVTPQEKEEGYKGNFATIRPYAHPNGGYELHIAKTPVPLRNHPQQAYNKKNHKHPDWKHPILRSIVDGKVYQSEDAARRTLESLYSQYPETSIPAASYAKLYATIYSKEYDKKNPTRKFILEVKPGGDGYVIKYRENPVISELRRPQIDEIYDEPYHFGEDV